MNEQNKYGTRLVDKKTERSSIKAIKIPQMLDENYIYSEFKDREKRKKFVWKSMDEEWKKNLSDKWWFKKDKESCINPKLYKLRDKLLSFGGEATCLFEIEEDLDDILENGQFWFGSGAKIMKGIPSHCHENSCNIYIKNKDTFDVRICTGYALSEDGMWRQHSWLVVHNPRSNRIIETTVPRIGYFGFVMSKKQCEEFCRSNYY